jgi:hypothetical protein
MLAAYADTLGAHPGIVVNSVEKSGGRVRVEGMRDPLSDPPAKLLAERGLPPADLSLRPFYSLDPALAERRLIQALRPPAETKLNLVDGTLRASGTAPSGWIDRARLLVPTLPAVEHYDDTELRTRESVDALHAAAADLEAVEVHFFIETTTPTSDEPMARARARMKELRAAAKEARLPVCVVIIGHTDPTGVEQQNQELSERRAKYVAQRLGAEPSWIGLVGDGVWRDAGSMQRARSATFRVDTERPYENCAVPR